MKRSLVFAALVLLACSAFAAQPPADAKLYDEIAAVDKTMFDAFNAHDVDRLGTFFAPNLEFFHDKDGLEGYAATMVGFKSLLSRNDGIRRRLVPGTLEVYPVPNYGAMEVGAHEFCHEEHGKTDCGTFQFLMVWQKKDGAWKVTRVMSYGH